jgi:hypothetical protein
MIERDGRGDGGDGDIGYTTSYVHPFTCSEQRAASIKLAATDMTLVYKGYAAYLQLVILFFESESSSRLWSGEGFLLRNTLTAPRTIL